LYRWTPGLKESKKWGKKELDHDRVFREPEEGTEDRKKLNKRLRRVARKAPGALYYSYLYRIHEKLHGDYPEKRRGVCNLKVATYLSLKSAVKDPKILPEAATLAEALDHLNANRLPQLADLLASRFLAVEESVARKGDWGRAKDWEVRRNISESLTGAPPQ
jgi:hypothetical protein